MAVRRESGRAARAAAAATAARAEHGGRYLQRLSLDRPFDGCDLHVSEELGLNFQLELVAVYLAVDNRRVAKRISLITRDLPGGIDLELIHIFDFPHHRVLGLRNPRARYIGRRQGEGEEYE